MKKCLASLVFAYLISLVFTSSVFAQGIDVIAAPKQQPNYVSDDMLLSADKNANDWMHYGKDYQSTRYSQLQQVNRDNVGDLKAKWYLSFGTLEGQDSQVNKVGDVIYVTTSFNRVIAADAATGDIRWKYEHELPADVYPELCCDVVNRGVAPYLDNVYLATLDAHLVALDNATGDVVYDVTVGDYTYAETMTLMPMALKGKIIVGTAGAEYGVRGWLQARSAADGSEVWKTYTIPTEGEPNVDTWSGESYKYGGGSTWITGSYDKELDILYWPVGNPGPDFDRHVRLGDNLYSNSTLALNPDDGAIKFWFQYTPNDPYDYDGVNEVVLADIDGKQVWLHGDRNGFVYSIDRTNARCQWATALGEINWTPPGGISPDRNNCRPIMAWEEGGNLEMDVVYDRVTKDIKPSLDGGKEWHPVCYSPKSNMVYVPTYNFSMDLQAKKMEWRRGEWYLGAKVLTFNKGNGAIKAFDASTGELAWVNPISAPATSGILCTAGGVAYYGDPLGYVHGVNDETGEELWAFNVGTGVHGNPTTYAVDGVQHVAFVVGAGGGGIWPLTFGEWLKNHTKGGGAFTFAVK